MPTGVYDRVRLPEIRCIDCGKPCARRGRRCMDCRRRKAGHGHSVGYVLTPTYRTWRTMKNRCLNPNVDNYRFYGGRGITVCARWRDSFEAFLADMGERPEGKTLDRFPNKNGNYEPGNCRWATMVEQMQNTRNFRGIGPRWRDGSFFGWAIRKVVRADHGRIIGGSRSAA